MPLGSRSTFKQLNEAICFKNHCFYGVRNNIQNRQTYWMNKIKKASDNDITFLKWSSATICGNTANRTAQSMNLSKNRLKIKRSPQPTHSLLPVCLPQLESCVILTHNMIIPLGAFLFCIINKDCHVNIIKLLSRQMFISDNKEEGKSSCTGTAKRHWSVDLLYSTWHFHSEATVKQIASHPKYIADVFTEILPLKICCGSAAEHALVLAACARQCEHRYTTVLY